ncbi:hypothetical protein CP967_27550 [Streptomyces nitrosporeus]|uniref:Uncharacterized protein n=1 Tax=Streptomyces nitrosporeus TaxID=28894 RepID=A0A5J6FJY1_9ACTN|nr:hypothetical protein [Streptomyces nitrosporeus]QEU75230.1 hypothetical protein CP967_27550 [Streptomyces nitrosporeus]
MRPARDPSGGASPTPIYDALYSEFRRSFRALPGDRTGEEGLGFRGFGTGLAAGRAPLSGFAANGQGSQSSQSTHAPPPNPGSWQRVGRHAGRSVRPPAALPPGSGTPDV